jgi:rare lipoprotein A
VTHIGREGTWEEFGETKQESALHKAILGVSAFFLMISQAQAGWVGQASYYTHPRYRFGLIAAHRTLPFGTHLLVTNLGNGRNVTVVVVDRGPFLRSRIIDLSTRAADMLGFRSAGLAQVKIEVVGEGKGLSVPQANEMAAVQQPAPLAPAKLIRARFVRSN